MLGEHLTSALPAWFTRSLLGILWLRARYSSKFAVFEVFPVEQSPLTYVFQNYLSLGHVQYFRAVLLVKETFEGCFTVVVTCDSKSKLQFSNRSQHVF
jgi:hypothetical protein